jgi:RNA polymerase sigma factor (sigma-70 family)
MVSSTTIGATEVWPGQETSTEAADDAGALVFALSELEEEQRLVVALRYHERLSGREIALVLGVPEEQVVATFAEALTRLRSRAARRFEQAA